MLIRRLAPSDAQAFQTLRLAALRECPSSFSSSYESESETPLAVIEARFAPDSGRHVFGAFDGDELLGFLGVAREEGLKVRHKASIRAMYVAANHRGKGVARRLLDTVIAFAAAMEGVRHVTLSVTAGNTAAIGLYEAIGFRTYGCEPGALIVDGVAYDDQLMILALESGAPN